MSACVLALTAAASSGTACRKPLPGNESALQARMDSEQNTRIRMHTHITDLEWCHLNKDGKDDSEHSPQCLLLGAAWEMYGIQRSQGCQKVTVWNDVAKPGTDMNRLLSSPIFRHRDDLDAEKVSQTDQLVSKIETGMKPN